MPFKYKPIYTINDVDGFLIEVSKSSTFPDNEINRIPGLNNLAINTNQGSTETRYVFEGRRTITRVAEDESVTMDSESAIFSHHTYDVIEGAIAGNLSLIHI